MGRLPHKRPPFGRVQHKGIVEYSRKMVVIMVIELTAQSVITFAALLSAIGGIVALVVKLVHWVDNQKAQDGKITDLETKHEADMKEMREETQLLMFGILSCLKGLQEQGCNGPVTDAVNKIEKYLNAKAHESKE